MPKPFPTFVQIHSLRGIAALMVVMVHANSFGDVEHFPSLLGKFIFQGARGVQLFYIISAFTLFYTFGLRKEEPNPVRNFLMRRFLRIAPLYYLAIAGYLALRTAGWAWQGHPMPSVWNVASNFLFLHGFSPFWINDVVPGGWSVGVEFPFYMALPLLFSRIRTLGDALRWQVGFMGVAIALPILMLQVKGVAGYDQWMLFITQFFPNQLPHFGFGIVLYFLLIRNETFLPSHYKWLYWLLLLYFGFASVSLYYLHYDWPVLNVVLSFWFSLGFSVVIYLVFTDPVARLRHPVLVFFGKISYGLYLTHFCGYYLLGHFQLLDLVEGTTSLVSLLNFGLRFLLCLGFSTLLAFLLHHAVELPVQRWGRR